jgi:hypothetical protein
MKMKNCRRAKIIVFLVFVSVSLCICAIADGQEAATCAQKLKSAQTSFALGQTTEVPSYLLGCIRSKGFKREEQLAAYKLLIQSYLLNDKPEQADSAMLAFLKWNPEYKSSPTDHSSFTYLYNSYDVKSLFSVSFRIGSNLPFLTFINEQPTSGDSVINSKYGSDAGNLFFSFEVKYGISKRMEVGMGIGYSQMKFKNNIDFYNFGHIQYLESQQRIEVPVCVTYDLTNGSRLIPYARGGLGAAFNLSSNADVTFKNDPGSKQGDRSGKTLDRNDSRRVVDLFFQAGAGIKYKIPRGFIFAEARSNMGMMQQYVPGGSTVDELYNKYNWADPGFRLNALNVNIGINIIFYKPLKKEEAK